MKATKIKAGHYEINTGVEVITIKHHKSLYNEYKSFWQAYDAQDSIASAPTKKQLIEMITPVT